MARAKDFEPELQDAVRKAVDSGLAAGLTNTELINRIQALVPTITKKSAVGWVNARREKLSTSESTLNRDRDRNRGMALLRLECIYAAAFESGDFGKALDAVKQMMAVQGTTPVVVGGPKKVTNTQNNLNITASASQITDMDQMSDAQLNARFKKGGTVSVEVANLLCEEGEVGR